MSLDEQISNLIKIKTLKEAVRDDATIEQHLLNARRLREDADLVRSALGKFTLAYEALHSIAMAFLTHHGVRTDGEGHRTVALQLAVGELVDNTNFSGAVSAITLIHGARNDSTYFKPIPPVSKKLADATLKLLDAVLAGADRAMTVPEAPSKLGR